MDYFFEIKVDRDVETGDYYPTYNGPYNSTLLCFETVNKGGWCYVKHIEGVQFNGFHMLIALEDSKPGPDGRHVAWCRFATEEEIEASNDTHSN